MTKVTLCPIIHTDPEPRVHVMSWDLTFKEAKAATETSSLTGNMVFVTPELLRGIEPKYEYEITFRNPSEMGQWAYYHSLLEGMQAIRDDDYDKVFVLCSWLVGSEPPIYLSQSLMWFSPLSQEIVVENR